MACQTSQFASANLSRVAYALESVFGTTPDPLDMKNLLFTGGSPTMNKETAISETIRPDRMTAGISEVGFTSGGTIANELFLGGAYDDWIEVAMSGQWSTPIDFTGALQITAGTGTVTDPGAGGTAFSNATEGQWVLLAGFTNEGNNGWFKILTIPDADTITVADPQTLLVDETGPGTTTAKGKTLINGVCENSFTVELGFTDVGVYLLFNGQRPNWTQTIAAGAIVTGGFDVLGTAAQVAATEFGNSYAASPISVPLNATSNVGLLTADGLPLTSAIQSVDFTVDNGYRSDAGVGSKFPVSIGYGRQTITGTLVAYLQNITNLQYMLNHTKLALALPLTDIDGNSMHIEWPAIHFLTDPVEPEGTDTTVVETIDWQAVPDDTGAYQMRVDMVP